MADGATPTDGSVGWIHSIDTGGAVDGPGVRFVFFLSGCLFRCQYCHNPDTWQPHHGRMLTVDQALTELAPYAGFLRIAGGVTVSGGEPLMQAPFVGELLRRAKVELGLHTALDTQGYLGVKVDDHWLQAVDLTLLDIKHADPDQYEALTGRPLQPTLDFARRLAVLNRPMWIRYVLVPGLTDGADDIERLAALVVSLGSAVERVEVLPFHQMGAPKWQALGLNYRLAATPAPTQEQIAVARAAFARHGLTVS